VSGNVLAGVLRFRSLPIALYFAGKLLARFLYWGRVVGGAIDQRSWCYRHSSQRKFYEREDGYFHLVTTRWITRESRLCVLLRNGSRLG
jgi:hypothetical protein